MREEPTRQPTQRGGCKVHRARTQGCSHPYGLPKGWKMRRMGRAPRPPDSSRAPDPTAPPTKWMGRVIPCGTLFKAAPKPQSSQASAVPPGGDPQSSAQPVEAKRTPTSPSAPPPKVMETKSKNAPPSMPRTMFRLPQQYSRRGGIEDLRVPPLSLKTNSRRTKR